MNVNHTSMKLKRRNERRGITMLELVIASSMLALVVTSISIVMRSGSDAWNAHQSDYTRLQAAHATVRHIVRRVRRADGVANLSSPSEYSGNLTLTMPGGETHVWDHDGNTDEVYYGIASPDHLMSVDIDTLRFEGFEADGKTPTSVPGDVQCLLIEATVQLIDAKTQLPVENNPKRNIRSWAWVRTW